MEPGSASAMDNCADLQEGRLWHPILDDLLDLSREVTSAVIPAGVQECATDVVDFAGDIVMPSSPSCHASCASASTSTDDTSAPVMMAGVLATNVCASLPTAAAAPVVALTTLSLGPINMLSSCLGAIFVSLAASALVWSLLSHEESAGVQTTKAPEAVAATVGTVRFAATKSGAEGSPAATTAASGAKGKGGFPFAAATGGAKGKEGLSSAAATGGAKGKEGLSSATACPETTPEVHLQHQPKVSARPVSSDAGTCHVPASADHCIGHQGVAGGRKEEQAASSAACSDRLPEPDEIWEFIEMGQHTLHFDKKYGGGHGTCTCHASQFRVIKVGDFGKYNGWLRIEGLPPHRNYGWLNPYDNGQLCIRQAGPALSASAPLQGAARFEARTKPALSASAPVQGAAPAESISRQITKDSPEYRGDTSSASDVLHS